VLLLLEYFLDFTPHTHTTAGELFPHPPDSHQYIRSSTAVAGWHQSALLMQELVAKAVQIVLVVLGRSVSG
jgi:hypothetical protein